MNFKIEKLEKYIDPFLAFWNLRYRKKIAFLDSSKKDEKLGKYSFIGLNPIIQVSSYKGNVKIEYYYGEKRSEEFKGDPFQVVESLIKELNINVDFNIPFVGGAIGYISYDMGRNLEKLPNTAKIDSTIDDLNFVFYDNILIFDNINQTSYISSLGIFSLEKNIYEDLEKKEEIVYNSNNKMDINDFTSNFGMEEYLNSITKLKNYIEMGHVYICNLTQRFKCNTNRDGFDIYKDLRRINPSTFGCYLNIGNEEIISSSPERFMQIVNGKVETRPIKGTRPRGNSKDEDEANKKELINSEKDKAELLMIVDLERNDLSKVCEPFSVKVIDLFKLEEYATVFHLVSSIEGRLKFDVSAVRCIKECFPGGSITGAPKIRAMEIIEELEDLRRNLYTGAIGYFDIRGNSDFNIAIRTIVKKGDEATFGVGGGITIESNENEEYKETLDKGKALMRVL